MTSMVSTLVECKSVVAGVDAAPYGTPLEIGTTELYAGATELYAGATELYAGATELYAGATEL